MDCRNSRNYESFENIFVAVLDRDTPRKSKIFCGNQNPHVRKNIRKAIMKRSMLKSKENRIKHQKIFRITENNKILQSD